jgi:hypothetical protein
VTRGVRHAGADTRASELAPYRVSGAAFEALHQDGDRQSWRVGHEQMHVVGPAAEFDQLGVESAQTPRMAFSVKVSMASVNTGRRYFVTNTRCA